MCNMLIKITTIDNLTEFIAHLGSRKLINCKVVSQLTWRNYIYLTTKLLKHTLWTSHIWILKWNFVHFKIHKLNCGKDSTYTLVAANKCSIIILGQDFVIEYHRQTKTEITSRTDLLIICRTYATTSQQLLKRFETLT